MSYNFITESHIGLYAIWHWLHICVVSIWLHDSVWKKGRRCLQGCLWGQRQLLADHRADGADGALGGLYQLRASPSRHEGEKGSFYRINRLDLPVKSQMNGCFLHPDQGFRIKFVDLRFVDNWLCWVESRYEAFQWDSEIRENHGDSWCICILSCRRRKVKGKGNTRGQRGFWIPWNLRDCFHWELVT